MSKYKVTELNVEAKEDVWLFKTDLSATQLKTKLLNDSGYMEGGHKEGKTYTVKRRIVVEKV